MQIQSIVAANDLADCAIHTEHEGKAEKVFYDILFRWGNDRQTTGRDTDPLRKYVPVRRSEI